MNGLQAYQPARLPQIAMEAARSWLVDVRPERVQQRINLVRLPAPANVTAACTRHGLPIELAELCSGLLASVVDDLVQCGRLPRTDFERTKRKQRIIEATQEPAASALRIAMAASPVNGRAAVAHWDVICEKYEVGKLAWLLGAETETAYRYGKRMEKQNERNNIV